MTKQQSDAAPSKSNGKMLVVSPHLDDAILSCGRLLAAHPGATVCTAFTAPPEETMTTDWDRRCGFADACEAMRARKAEDVQALRCVGATPLHLPFCDAQYHASPSRDALVESLKDVVEQSMPAKLVIPMGLFHSDHILVANACLALLPLIGRATVCVYEDVPYRRIEEILQARLTLLARHGYVLDAMYTPLEADARHQRIKDAALDAYASQLLAFGPEGKAGLAAPERHWRLRDASGATSPPDAA